MESRLEARDVQLQQMARLFGCGTWTLEPDTGELTCSAHCAGLLGIATDTRLGFDVLLELAFAEDRARVRHAFTQAVRVRDDFTVEFRLAGEGHRWVRCVGRSHASALNPDRHALSGVLTPMTDAASTAAHAPDPRLGALVDRLERLRELDLRTVASRLMSEIAPRLTDLRQRVAALAAERDLAPLVRAELAAVAEETAAWLDSLRTVVFELIPPAVAELGFEGALERYASEQMAAAGIELTLSLPAEPLPLATSAQEALYQAARAGLDNVVRHAGAKKVRVGVETNGREVLLSIVDDGVGIRQADLMKDGALRLFTESERLAAQGGDLRVSGRPGQGTVFEARVALNQKGYQQQIPLRVA
jgi:two-component system sensor histidine kinase UhpB